MDQTATPFNTNIKFTFSYIYFATSVPPLIVKTASGTSDSNAGSTSFSPTAVSTASLLIAAISHAALRTVARRLRFSTWVISGQKPYMHGISVARIFGHSRTRRFELGAASPKTQLNSSPLLAMVRASM